MWRAELGPTPQVPLIHSPCPCLQCAELWGVGIELAIGDHPVGEGSIAVAAINKAWTEHFSKWLGPRPRMASLIGLSRRSSPPAQLCLSFCPTLTVALPPTSADHGAVLR